MKTTKKSTYPAYPVDVHSDVVLHDNNGQVLFRSHEFDRPSKYKWTKKWCKNKLTYGDVPLSGLQPLRHLYYKINESKIPATLSRDILEKNINMFLLSNYFKKAATEKK